MAEAKGAAEAKGVAEAKGAAGAKAGGKRRLALERRLLALPEAYAAAPDYSVVTILHETRAIEAILQKYGKDLLSGTKLDRKTPAEIGARRLALEEAERDWVAARESESPRALTRLRQEAEGLVRDVAAALRYFLEHDATVQRRVGAIREGAGDADRIDDLKRCAELLELHADALKRADLPKKAPRRCRELADELAAASAERDAGRGGVLAAQELRNRAYWHLRELMDEVRAAGRYVFRHEPKRLTLFRASSTNARHASRPPPPGPSDDAPG
ncbi:MAG: hypothetical protein MUF34_01695 [Polyangiaceae bacterium]|nr:hypothetical protein [Polyangiaceae bacterium]